MSAMTILGDDKVDMSFLRPVVGSGTCTLDSVQLSGEHLHCLWILANRMRGESDEVDYQPTYEHVIKYALQHAVTMVTRGANRCKDA